jgi:DNA-binding NarL/FixJ family response regulator
MARALQTEFSSRWKVLIVDDHPVFRQGLVQVMQDEPDLAICGQVGSAEQALQVIPRLKPHLVLVDITLPGKNGLELIKEVRRANRKIKLLAVSMHDEAVYADRVLRAGGDGYVMKHEDPDEIVHAIRDILAGYVYVSEQVLPQMQRGHGPRRPARKPNNEPLARLTDTELEVLELLGRGRTNQEIAQQMQLSPGKVVAHCAHIKKGLNLETTNALIRYAVCWVEGAGG